jgi:hypothetical protein
VLLADNAGAVAEPGQAASAAEVGRRDLGRAAGFLPGRDRLNGSCGADAAAQGAGVLAVALGHDEARGPEARHAGLSEGGVDDIGRADPHAQPDSMSSEAADPIPHPRYCVQPIRLGLYEPIYPKYASTGYN